MKQQQPSEYKKVYEEGNFSLYIKEEVEVSIGCSEELEIVLANGENKGQHYEIKRRYHDENLNILKEGKKEEQQEYTIREKK